MLVDLGVSSQATRRLSRLAALTLAGVGLLGAANVFTKIPHPNFRHQDEWYDLFDGATLNGWKADQNAQAWSVKDGAIRGDGGDGRLIFQDETCVNCEVKADVKISHGGIAGIYVRGKADGAVFHGYEALINNTSGSGDAGERSGALEGFVKMYGQLVEDDAWFTEDILVQGNHVLVTVNGKVTADYTDEKNTYFSGSIALAQSGPGTVEFKNVELLDLPAPVSPLRGVWRAKGDASGPEIRIEEERDALRYTSNTDNFWARTDGEDYILRGSPAYDHISLIEITRHHNLHQGMHMAKVRKQPDPHAYAVQTKLGWNKVASSTWTVSADGKTLTEEGPSGKTVLERVQ